MSMITLVAYTENTYSVSIVIHEILILEDLFSALTAVGLSLILPCYYDFSLDLGFL